MSAWTTQQHATLVRMAKEGSTGSEIGRAIGKSRSAVLGYAWRSGITLPPSPRKLARGTPVTIRNQVAFALMKRDNNPCVVAAQWGVHLSTVYRWKREAGL